MSSYSIKKRINQSVMKSKTILSMLFIWNSKESIKISFSGYFRNQMQVIFDAHCVSIAVLLWATGELQRWVPRHDQLVSHLNEIFGISETHSGSIHFIANRVFPIIVTEEMSQHMVERPDLKEYLLALKEQRLWKARRLFSMEKILWATSLMLDWA